MIATITGTHSVFIEKYENLRFIRFIDFLLKTFDFDGIIFDILGKSKTGSQNVPQYLTKYKFSINIRLQK